MNLKDIILHETGWEKGEEGLVFNGHNFNSARHESSRDLLPNNVNILKTIELHT